MNWRIEPLPDDGPRFDGAIDVYAEAFALPPYSDPDRGEEIRYRLRQVHRQRAGYRGLIAVDERGDVVGMTYGYHSAPGQWWYDAVARTVRRKLAAEWLADAYELVEIAVHPAAQSQGIGAALVRELLDGRPEATCVLSTRADSRAHELYARLGFETVIEMAFTPGGAPFYVMGKKLGQPARPAAIAPGSRGARGSSGSP